jgi:cell division septation protein DedD
VLERLDSDSTATLSTEDAHKERMPLVWISATLSIGLLIAVVYLGGRILAGHSPAPAPVKTVMPVAAKPAAAAVQAKSEPLPQPTSEELEPVVSDQLPMIAPQAGERYIQVSALNMEAARRYLTKLRLAKLEPHVAPGPSPEVLRVLLGPFADQDALAQTKSDLARARIKYFVRKY